MKLVGMTAQDSAEKHCERTKVAIPGVRSGAMLLKPDCVHCNGVTLQKRDNFIP